MNLNLDIRNLTDRETFDGMIAALGGEDLDRHTTAQRTARLTLERGLTEQTRPAFLTYSDATNDGAGVREEAAARAGLLLGVGIGVALNAYPEQDAISVAHVAAEVVAGVVSAGVGSVIAQDIARQVLRALARLTDEPAAV